MRAKKSQIHSMTQRQYIEYLIATSVNYTCTNHAEHLEGEPSISKAKRHKVTMPSAIFCGGQS